MLQHNTDLSDLLGPQPGIPAPHYQRAAEGPSPVPAIPAAPTRRKPASDEMIIAEAIPATMTEVEIAAFLGIVTSQVRTKTKDGILVKNGRARWDVRASLQDYLSQLRDGAIRGGGQVPDELKAEKLRLAREQADKLEIANAAARGDMVRAADVEREWANVLRDVRSTMLAVPSRVGSKLAHLSAHDVAEIDSEIKAALEGLANGN